MPESALHPTAVSPSSRPGERSRIRRVSSRNRRAWADANTDFAAGRYQLLESPHAPPMWATATFLRQVSIINDEERAGILSAARAVSVNPYQPHPVLAARRLMREPLGALTMGGRHRLFLTWRVDPESGRTVLLTVERPGA